MEGVGEAEEERRWCMMCATNEVSDFLGIFAIRPSNKRAKVE